MCIILHTYIEDVHAEVPITNLLLILYIEMLGIDSYQFLTLVEILLVVMT